ncbi:uncharacterized protein LOC123524351 [Mercenaria mercenaria]|uniref:uncharacterized protein LOC123524351 n=1 Tax=Mercenaria mercenaria TaxID=6596 RepID=UPI00234F5415|nr:uncharacterized protein LOC123524351 [Mercenaria mercenaria]
MPLQTRRSQASTTFYGHSTEPVKTGESKNSNFRASNRSNLHSFRVLPSYPTPQQRREITSDASASSFRTSYVMPDDSSDSESDASTESNLSRAFYRERTLARGTFRVDESSDEESAPSETVTNLTYSSIHLTPRSRQLQREAYKFNVEGTGAILCIMATRAGQCWISRYNDKILHLYHRNGHKKESKTISEKVSMMCLRQDRTFLVTPQFSRSIFKMAPSGKMTTFLTFELEIGGFCSTSRNEILVTTTPIQKSQKKGPRPRRTPSVLRFGQSGEALWEIKVKGIATFVKPSKIEVNVNGDICVLDHETSKEHLIILSPDGEEKKRYYGIQDKVLDHPFEPKDICCDKEGFIYIADVRNNTVHVLDKHGNFHHFLFTKHDGNKYPCAIACDSEGFLWVGLSSGAIRVYKLDHKTKSK